MTNEDKERLEAQRSLILALEGQRLKKDQRIAELEAEVETNKGTMALMRGLHTSVSEKRDALKGEVLFYSLRSRELKAEVERLRGELLKLNRWR